jgi:hypothetical protein
LSSSLVAPASPLNRHHDSSESIRSHQQTQNFIMTQSTAPPETAVGSPAPRQKSRATVDTLRYATSFSRVAQHSQLTISRIGCIAMVEKVSPTLRLGHISASIERHYTYQDASKIIMFAILTVLGWRSTQGRNSEY